MSADWAGDRDSLTVLRALHFGFLRPGTVLHTYFLPCAYALKWPRPQVWVFGQGQCQVMTFENIKILSQQKEVGMGKKRHENRYTVHTPQ